MASKAIDRHRTRAGADPAELVDELLRKLDEIPKQVESAVEKAFAACSRADVTGREILSRVQAAELMDLSPKTLEAWAAAGEGPRFLKIGRRCVYRRADLDAYLQARARGAVAGDL